MSLTLEEERTRRLKDRSLALADPGHLLGGDL